jgi:hypothetical protein
VVQEEEEFEREESHGGSQFVVNFKRINSYVGDIPPIPHPCGILPSIPP